MGLRSRCRSGGRQARRLTLPAKKLYEIVKALPDTDVSIETEKGGTGVKVAAERFSRACRRCRGRTFRAMPRPPARRRRPSRVEALAQMVAKTQFAITGEDTRYFLNGALFVLGPEQMSLVATDGHRLALVHADSRRHAQGRGT